MSDLSEEFSYAKAKPIDAIFSALSDSIFVLDRNGRYQWINHSAAAALGLKQSEVIGKTAVEIGIPGGIKDQFEGQLKKVLASEKPFSGEGTISVSYEGRSFEYAIAPIFGEDGMPHSVLFCARDMGNRENTEGALEEGESRYRKIFEEGPIGIGIIDPEYRFMKANVRLSQMLGYSEQELIGHAFSTITHPDDIAKDMDLADKLFTGEIPFYQIDKRYIRKSGEVFWGRLTASIVRDEQGNVLYGLGLIEDINERKNIEEELRFKSLLLDNASDSVFVVELDGTMLYVNEAAYRARGYTKEELMAMALRQLDTPEYAELIRPRFEAMMRTGSQVFESVHIKKSGNLMPVEVHARVLEYGGRNVIAGVVRDITERKRVERAVRESEARYRTLAEKISAITYIASFENPNIVFYVSPQVEAFLGYTQEQFVSEPDFWARHVHPDDLERVLDELSISHADGDHAVSTEYRMITHDGSIRWFRDEASIVKDETGSPLFLQGVMFDISDNRRAKELSDALNDINAAINSTLDIDEIMERVVVESAQAIGCETAAIDTYKDHRWVTKYIYGFPEEIRGVELTDEEAPHAALSAIKKQQVVINDAHSDSRVNRETMERFNIKSVMVTLLIVRGETIGTLFHNYHSSRKSFTEAEVDFAKKIATSISLALENAHLYDVQRHIAETLQETLLAMPEQIPGVEFGHLYRSATEAAQIGGDFYDIFEVDRGKVGVIVGDVAGKGIEATAITTVIKNTIKAHAYEDKTPAIIMAKTNDLAQKATPADSFITVFLGILDTDTGQLLYCSAGHPPALVKREEGGVELLEKHSPMIGAFSRLHYRTGKATLRKGDILIAYTDGIIEARHNQALYGQARLVELVKRAKPTSTQEMPHLILDDVMRYVGEKLTDDVAIMAVSMLDVVKE